MSPVAEYRQMTASAPRRWFRHAGASTVVISPSSFERVAFIDEFVRKVKQRAKDVSQMEDGEPTPTKETINCVVRLVLESGIPLSLLTKVSISTYYGELDLTWGKGTKEVTLMCGGPSGDNPKIHHYWRRAGQPTDHGLVTEGVSSDEFLRWTRWLDV
jgi:hypothetical protein